MSENSQCGDLMLPKWDVRCQLEPGHAGEHYAKTENVKYTWWNDQINMQRLPQKPEQKETT
jgi:hypothetical protein